MCPTMMEGSIILRSSICCVQLLVCIAFQTCFKTVLCIYIYQTCLHSFRIIVFPCTGLYHLICVFNKCRLYSPFLALCCPHPLSGSAIHSHSFSKSCISPTKVCVWAFRTCCIPSENFVNVTSRWFCFVLFFSPEYHLCSSKCNFSD